MISFDPSLSHLQYRVTGNLKEAKSPGNLSGQPILHLSNLLLNSQFMNSKRSGIDQIHPVHNLRQAQL